MVDARKESRIRYVTERLFDELQVIGKDGTGNWLSTPKTWLRSSDFANFTIPKPAVFLHVAKIETKPRAGNFLEYVTYRVGALAEHAVHPDRELHNVVADLRRRLRELTSTRIEGAVETGWLFEKGYEALVIPAQGGVGLGGGVIEVEARFTTDALNP